ncbi:MAG: phytoene/squalene synthase family protein [Burkholderiales bacterium]|nr:phytoene/squalene synthase family protein [Burkholderiales bacterium]
MRPRSPEAAAPADIAACAAMLRQGSRTFFAASLVLPRAVRLPATALYAFCRLADDAVDAERDPRGALARLRERLERVYAGRPADTAAERAFAGVVARFAIPRALPEALLEGFEWDAGGRRYETLAELNAYAARVAGAVGAMMALVMGARSGAVLARACDLGVAMQLTNIARDVGEDARLGRIYLPCAWLREAGIDPDAWLARPAHSEALGAVVQRLLDAADALYARAAAGVSALPAGCRPGMHAARLLYAEIGREVERRGLDSVTTRAVVPAARKAQLLWGALAAAARPQPMDASPPLAETRFLVEAAAAGHAAPEPAARIPLWNVEARLARIIDLFERLERREQVARAAGRA